MTEYFNVSETSGSRWSLHSGRPLARWPSKISPPSSSIRKRRTTTRRTKVLPFLLDVSNLHWWQMLSLCPAIMVTTLEEDGGGIWTSHGFFTTITSLQCRICRWLEEAEGVDAGRIAHTTCGPHMGHSLLQWGLEQLEELGQILMELLVKFLAQFF